MIRRLAAVLCLTLLALLSACRDKVNPNQSQLLDGAQACFLGDSAMKEMPGKALAWDADHVLLTGRRKAAGAGKEIPYRDFLWLAGADGKIKWDLALDTFGIRDLAVLDSTRVLALVGGPREQSTASAFELWQLDRSGEILARTRHTALDDQRAFRLTRIGADHFVVTCWRQNADSTGLIYSAMHVNARGEAAAGTWEYPAEKFYPLAGGGFLALRNRFSRDGSPMLSEIARLRADGGVAWKVEHALDSVQAGINGVVETADGGFLLTGHRESLFDPLVARFSADGKLLWSKRPPEMEGYELYSLAPWGEGRFLVAAQKPLMKGQIPSAKQDWDCLAAFVIDAEGNVLDRDLLPQHWTMPVGGVQTVGDRAFFTGAGAADATDGMRHWDLALYVLDAADSPVAAKP